MKKIGDNLVATGGAVITFDLIHPPKWLDLGWRTVPVHEYIANPLKCRNCQKLGHTKNYCRDIEQCKECGFPPPHEVCTRKFCVNCNNDTHTSSDPTCPSFLTHKSVNKIKAKRRCTAREAWRIFNEDPSNNLIEPHRPKVSYAQVLANGNSSKKDAVISKKVDKNNATTSHKVIELTSLPITKSLVTSASNPITDSLASSLTLPITHFTGTSSPGLLKTRESSEKQFNTVLEILAEHKVLLDRIVSQNAVVSNTMNIFSIRSEEKLKELDALLSTQADPYIRQIKKLLGGNAERNLHLIFGHAIIMDFNVDGTLGKKRLRDYVNVFEAMIDAISSFTNSSDKCLRAVFQRQKKKYFKQSSRSKTTKNDENNADLAE